MMKRVIIASLLIMSAFLQNPSLVAAQTSVTLYPVADNYADSKYPTRTYGYDSFLFVGNKYDLSQGIWGSERIYIRFNLTGLPNNLVVVRATLQLWQYNAPKLNQTYETHRVLAEWNETEQNWDNQPASAATITSEAVAPAQKDVAIQWDITADVKAWHSGEAPNYGTMIKVAKEERCPECQDASSGFWSREYPARSHEEWRPRLVVVLEGNPALTYVASVGIVGLPSELATVIEVDGGSYGSASSGKEERITFDRGTTHNITVSKLVVSGSPGVRYICDANQAQVSSGKSYVFTYAVEYMVSFSTDPPSMFETPASGWYRPGDVLWVNHTGPEVINETRTTRFLFHGWSVNSQKVTANSTSVTVNEPIAVVGRYDADYYLNVTSPIGETKGSGWYLRDSTASFSIDRTTAPAQGLLGLLGLRRSFSQWVGSNNFLGVSVEPQGSLIMKEPTDIEAVWQDDYSSLALNIALVILVVAIVGVAVTARKRRSRSMSRPERLVSLSESPPASTIERQFAPYGSVDLSLRAKKTRAHCRPSFDQAI
jgi:hypothetical protein